MFEKAYGFANRAYQILNQLDTRFDTASITKLFTAVADEEAGEEYSALFVDSPNYQIHECRDFLKNFAYKEPVFKAGTNVRYCNCSFVLLGLAIEAVTGHNFREYILLSTNRNT